MKRSIQQRFCHPDVRRDRGVLLEEFVYFNKNATIPPDVGMTKSAADLTVGLLSNSPTQRMEKRFITACLFSLIMATASAQAPTSFKFD
ncbi:MAG TPA: hypothetical protein VGB67_00710, partial [Fibrella sp.]